MISPMLRAAAAEVRGEVDRILVEEAVAELDICGIALEALALSFGSVLGLDSEAAWRLAFDALSSEFLTAP